MSKYIDADKLIANLERQNVDKKVIEPVIRIIASLQQEIPDKDTIIRICKLHKVWSITAPWEKIEDFVTTNWNSKNIV